MIRRTLTALGCAFGAMIILLGPAWAAAPVKVVVTFSVLGDMVQQLGGDAVAVSTLVAPGGDAHVYQPTPSDAKILAKADLIVVNGLGMEGWLDRLIAASGTKAPIVVASTGVPTQVMQEDGKPVTDPHAWQNVANGRIYIRNISAGLIKANPSHAATFRQRAETYDRELGDIDAWVRQQISLVPAEKRKVITSHDAFGYFGKAYGVTFLAPVGISTESEPTATGIGQLVKQIRAEHIKALFIENMADPRLIDTLAHETGAVIGGTVYSDSLSPQPGPADTYIRMFRHNVPAMTAAMNMN